MQGILRTIWDHKRESVRRAKERLPEAALLAEAASGNSLPGVRGGASPYGVRAGGRGDCGGEEGEPLKGVDPTGFQTRGNRCVLCGGRCRLPLGAYRGGVFPWGTGSAARSAADRYSPDSPEGLRARSVSGAGSPRLGSRRGTSDRGGAFRGSDAGTRPDGFRSWN